MPKTLADFLTESRDVQMAQRKMASVVKDLEELVRMSAMKDYEDIVDECLNKLSNLETELKMQARR